MDYATDASSVAAVDASVDATVDAAIDVSTDAGASDVGAVMYPSDAAVTLGTAPAAPQLLIENGSMLYVAAVSTTGGGIDGGAHLAGDDTYVYVTQPMTQSVVRRLKLATGVAATVLAVGEGTVSGIAVDDKNIYWTDLNNLAIRSLAKQ